VQSHHTTVTLAIFVLNPGWRKTDRLGGGGRRKKEEHNSCTCFQSPAKIRVTNLLLSAILILSSCMSTLLLTETKRLERKGM